jgi:hypothetical protein
VIEVKSVDSIESMAGSFLILITPSGYEKQIIQELKEKKIYNYLPFSDCPVGVDLSEESNCFLNLLKKPQIKGCISLYGISWFNLYLYDYYAKLGMSISICKSENDNDVVCDLLKNEYEIYDHNEALCEVDYFFASEEVTILPKEKIIDIEGYVENLLYPVYNNKLIPFKDKHKGEKCCIVATGPSLKVSDLDMLKENNIKCISMNRIYNLFERTSWRPDYYVIEDKKMIEDLANEIANLDLKYKFVNGGVNKYWALEQSKSSVAFKMVMQDCLSEKVGFSKELERFIYNGYTVTYVCLQLAMYMGFSDIYLLGVDFNYSSDVYSESNHFEGYQKHYKDIRLNAVMPERMLNAYKKAKKVAEYSGRHIYNGTRGGKLEVFDRRNIECIKED